MMDMDELLACRPVHFLEREAADLTRIAIMLNAGRSGRRVALIGVDLNRF